MNSGFALPTYDSAPVTSSWSPDSPGEPYGGPPAGSNLSADRPRYRPPIGIPEASHRGWVSTLISVSLHVLVILLLLAPLVAPSVLREVDGAGGPGPAGGGGGGTQGTGGTQGASIVERLRFVQIAAPPPAPTPIVKVPDLPKPVVTPPVPPPTPTPTPAPVAAPTAAAPAAAAPTPGTGGGTGSDGTAGSGPGSGGGVGSGIGTGRGSGTGPGTGGGNATIYPPVATEIFLPPWPVPNKVKGTQLIAEFDVDSLGHVVSFDFTKTNDGGYNRKLNEVLRSIRFRPATRADGQPIRAKGSLTYVF
jgi:hypothetical protein